MSSTSSSVSALPLPPGPRGLPVLGSLLDISRDTHLAINRLAQRYGDVYRLCIGAQPAVVISHPDLVQEAFNRMEMADRAVSEVFTIMSEAKTLAQSPYGDHWRQLRHFASEELFTPDNLRIVRENHIEPGADELADRIGGMAGNGELVPLHALIAQSMYDILFRAFFGQDQKDGAEFEQLREAMQQHVDWLGFANTAPNPPEVIPFLKFLPARIVKEAHQQKAICKDLLLALTEIVQSRSSFTPGAPSCFLDVVLAKTGGDDSASLSPSLDCLAPSGQLSRLIQWALLIIANRPDVQAKIHQEMDSALAPGAVPGVADHARLPYTFACIAESMRYRAVAPMGVPHKATADMELGGCRIPAGVMVIANVYGIHHDPRFWDTPHEFIPERFLLQPDGAPAPGLTNPAYMPFGTGIRRCVGDRYAETIAWLCITRMLHRFRLETPAGIPLPEDEVFAFFAGPKPYALRAARRE